MGEGARFGQGIVGEERGCGGRVETFENKGADAPKPVAATTGQGMPRLSRVTESGEGGFGGVWDPVRHGGGP
jgi:hypothetical protein